MFSSKPKTFVFFTYKKQLYVFNNINLPLSSADVLISFGSPNDVKIGKKNALKERVCKYLHSI